MLSTHLNLLKHRITMLSKVFWQHCHCCLLPMFLF